MQCPPARVYVKRSPLKRPHSGHRAGTRGSIALCALALLAPVLVGAEQALPQSKTIRLLHIGNSFSNNATTYLPQLVQASGHTIEISGLTFSGGTLERHAKHMKLANSGQPGGSPYDAGKNLGLPAHKKKVSIPEALSVQEWDFVTIQQGSHNSFRSETFEPYAGELIAQIREKAPAATILIHQTWTYRQDHKLLRQENMTRAQMHQGLSAAYNELGERYGLGFLPVGNAILAASLTDEWDYARDSDYNYSNPPQDQVPNEKGLYTGYTIGRSSTTGKPFLWHDAFHLNTAGKYLASCVWYEILFQLPVTDVDFTPEGLTPEESASLRALAHQSVAAYRANGLLQSPEPSQTPHAVTLAAFILLLLSFSRRRLCVRKPAFER